MNAYEKRKDIREKASKLANQKRRDGGADEPNPNGLRSVQP